MATDKWKEENADKMRQYRRDYYYKNKTSHYKRNKITEDKIKAYIQSQKTPCKVCGESEKACIDFHHLHSKDESVSQLSKYGSLNRVKKEINKCICLCANCHRKLHAKLISVA